MQHAITQLPSGLRVATAEMPEMESVSVGIWIGVGGRHESARLSGVSHFLEHLLFKGTRRRTARQISQAVEGIGGYLNAFTGEETTCYYARAGHQHLDTLLDVLTDMYLHPQFAPADIAKERHVIKEELLMYHDQPDHYVQELLIETLWPGHPLGRSLAGTPQTLDAMNRSVLRDYQQRRYLASNTVVTIAGHCRHDDFVWRVEKSLALTGNRRAPGFAPAVATQRRPQLRLLDKKVEQTHLALGIRAYSRHDRRRYALKLLSILLGENMSSRLFQVIREKHGLAYSIHSGTSFLADTGALVVSAGLETKKFEKALALILRELHKLARRPPTATELRQTKDYAIGQMRLSLENTSNRMMWLGEHLLSFGVVHTPEEIERAIEAVTTADLQAVAADIFRDHRLNVAVIAPQLRPERITGLLTFE
jgi:predicted Zn-dependent peptidase